MGMGPEFETTARSRQSRIPATLQAVFLASNRGKEVNKPPPEKVAYKVFFRNWLFQRKSNSSDGKNNSFEKEKLKSIPPCVPPKKTYSAPLPKTTATSQPQPPVMEVQIPATSTPHVPLLSPQGFLDSMLHSRGYSTKKFKTLQTAYYNKPTPLQQASYDVYLIELARNRQAGTFEAVIGSGISTNPCNTYGESLVHMLCRRGDHELLQIMIKHGCYIQVADDYGRTPLHDACWAAQPNFEVVEIILQHDRRLFHMLDCRGSLPLSYAKKEHWAAWIQFLDTKKDTYWPIRDVTTLGEEAPPELTLEEPNSRPIPPPSNALTVELAGMVAAGRMEPEEAQFLKYDNTEDVTGETSDEDDDDEDDYDSEDDGSDYDSDAESELTMDDDEMANILSSMPISHAKMQR